MADITPKQISLTIIVPTLNCGSTLSETLVSLLPLIRHGAKAIVVDSFSTDNTAAIALQYGATIRQVPPGNMYNAINEGINMAATEWVTYLNGDDVCYPDAIFLAIDTISENADIVYGSIDFIDAAGRFLHSWSSAPVDDIVPLAMAHVMAIPQQGTLFRRSVAARLCGFSTTYRFASDYDFFLRAKLAKFRFVRFNKPRIAAFRVHSGQISQHRSVEMANEVMQSTKQNNVRSKWLSVKLAFTMHRLRNWDSYVIRFIRSRHLKGKTAVSSTIGL